MHRSLYAVCTSIHIDVFSIKEWATYVVVVVFLTKKKNSNEKSISTNSTLFLCRALLKEVKVIVTQRIGIIGIWVMPVDGIVKTKPFLTNSIFRTKPNWNGVWLAQCIDAISVPILINTLRTQSVNESERDRSAFEKWCLYCNLYLSLILCFVDSRLLLLHQFWKQQSIQRDPCQFAYCATILWICLMHTLRHFFSPILSFVRLFLCCCSGICHFVNCNAILCTRSIHCATANRWENRQWMNKSWKIEINANDSINRIKVERTYTVHIQSFMCGRQTEEDMYVVILWF